MFLCVLFGSYENIIMKNHLLILLFSCVCTVLASQDCDRTFWFSSQADIDSFPLRFPDCINIYGELRVFGDDVTNVDSLIQIEYVSQFVHIRDSALENIDGLANLEGIGHNMVITNNRYLKSIEGIRNLSDFDLIAISDNPLLALCSYEHICNHLEKYGRYYIGNNSPGCNNRYEVLSSCNIDIDGDERVEIMFEGFENYDNEDLPENWINTFEVNRYDLVPNMERVSSLSEGDNAILLRSNIPFFEGNIDTYIQRELDDNSGLIDIHFTYSCTGEGLCSVVLGQGFPGETGSNARNVWNVLAGDSTVRTVSLYNIPVNEPFDEFNYVLLMASPVWTPVGSYGISEFTIDSLSITRKDISASSISFDHHDVVIYPNPAEDLLNINTNRKLKKIIISNALGYKLKTYSPSEIIDIAYLDNGVYYLILISEDMQSIHKFVRR